MKEYIKRLNNSVKKYNSKILLVGGTVRDNYLSDKLLSKESDLDILIFNMEDKFMLKNVPNDLILKESNEDIKVYTSEEYPNIDITFTGKITNDKICDKDIINYQYKDYRDFKVNSMYEDLDGVIYDSHKGLEDIINGVLDYTRYEYFTKNKINYLRALMFCSRFNLKPSERLSKAILDGEGIIESPTPHLVSEVLNKGLVANPVKMYKLLYEYNILDTIFDYNIKYNEDVVSSLEDIDSKNLSINNKKAYIWLTMTGREELLKVLDGYEKDIFKYSGNGIRKYIKNIMENYYLYEQSKDITKTYLNFVNRVDFIDYLYFLSQINKDIDVEEELRNRDNYLLSNKEKVMSYVSKKTLIDLGLEYTKGNKKLFKTLKEDLLIYQIKGSSREYLIRIAEERIKKLK